MSVEQSAKAWKLDVQGSLKLVLLSLADHADSHGRHVYPSQEYTSQRCGISVRQVRRLLHQLEEMGLIIPVKHPKGGRGMATEYELKLDQPETPETNAISIKRNVSDVSPMSLPVTDVSELMKTPLEEFINQSRPVDKDSQTLAHDVFGTLPSTEQSTSFDFPWTWGVGGASTGVVYRYDNGRMTIEKADKLSGFRKTETENQTRPNESENPVIYDIKGDIQDINPDIAMSDQPSRTIIEPSIEPLDGAKAPKPQPIYPEWFKPLTTLHGFVNRAYPKAIPTIEAQCKASGVSVSTVVATFAEYYPDNYIRHGWSNPVMALNRTLDIQINKVKGAKQTTAPRQEPTGDIIDVWAATAARFEGKNTDDDKTEN